MADYGPSIQSTVPDSVGRASTTEKGDMRTCGYLVVRRNICWPPPRNALIGERAFVRQHWAFDRAARLDGVGKELHKIIEALMVEGVVLVLASNLILNDTLYMHSKASSNSQSYSNHFVK